MTLSSFRKDTSNKSVPTSEKYWAAEDTRTCADTIYEKCEDYWAFCLAKGWYSTWRRMYYAYNPNRYMQAQTVQSGDSNEYRTIKVNHFRNLLEHIQTLSITDRPAWQPQSTNNDAKSAKQCIIAEGVLDYYMREKRVERHLHDATRNGLLFTEGFVLVEWDPFVGQIIAQDPDTGVNIHEGDISYHTLEPVDLVRDPDLKSFDQRDWVVCRLYENKYNLAAKYPEYEKEITGQLYSPTARDHYLGGQFLDRSNNSDLIAYLKFFHVKCPACPDGRQMIMLADGTVLQDGILPYEHLPLFRITPANQIGTAMGQSVSTDLMPLQEMVDAHYTSILSINENYGIPKVLLPIGSDIMADNMASGFTMVTYNPQVGKPEVMMMPTAPEGLFEALKQLQQEMETLSGVNSVARGQPEPSLKSGSALALVQSMAIQFNAPLQQSYVGLLEDVGTATLQILKEYAQSPRIVQIAGKRNKGIIQQAFSGKDIDTITRVQVQAGNPLSKTISGRLAIAQDLLQNKIITTPEEYLMVLETGELDPLTEGPTQELLNLKTENELLGEGQQLPVLFTDNHILHINEHSALGSDPIVRQNPQQFKVISDHIMQHINMLTDPAYQNYRQLMNQPSLPPIGQQPAAPAGTPPNVPQGQPPAATQMAAATQAPMNPQMGNGQIQQMAQNVRPPRMPQPPPTRPQ